MKTLRQSGGLPPRRISAADAAGPKVPRNLAEPINIRKAQDRLLEAFEREQLPNEVASDLAAALNGDLHRQSLLFAAMMDSWPKLQRNIAEIAREVSVAPWKVVPYSRRNDDPTPEAQDLADEIEDMLWTMHPDAARLEMGLEDIIKAIATGYYTGHEVDELLWERDPGGLWRVRAAKSISARYYGYPYFNPSERDPDDRLMYDPNGGYGARQLIDFPENRFLVAINSGHMGHPAVAAPLRALAPYWLAAVYGLKWLMHFTQLFGVPWRHAEVNDPKDDNAVARALAGIGSQGYIVTRPGTKINVLGDNRTGDAVPQSYLIDLADRQCDLFVLGQTLTSGTDDSGSRALGEVHAQTRTRMVDAVADHVGKVLSYQLIPSLIRANYGGNRADAPGFWVRDEDVRDEMALAQRDAMIGIADGRLPVSRAWFYERHGIPVPEDGEDRLVVAPAAVAPSPSTFIAAADAPKAAGIADKMIRELTGVSSDWLGPVRPEFERLARLAMSKRVSDEDFAAALEEASAKMPELFGKLDTAALEEALEIAMRAGAATGLADS